MPLDIRQMTPADLELVLGWAEAEGWNPGLDDAAAFLVQDPSGFLIGMVDAAPVCAISVVKYGTDFAFLGLYIVRPEQRGQGYGKAIWDAGIASAGSRTIGLDGVPDQQANYRREGFHSAHANARWGGRLSGLGAPVEEVRPITPLDLASVLDFDRAHVAAPRDAFLSTWVGPSASRTTLGFFAGDRLGGYGTIRRCVEGWKVGPLFAESAEIAEALLAGLGLLSGSEPVFVDCPEPNAAATQLVTRLGFTPSFATARMYRGPAPALPLAAIFGITTLELG